MNIAVTYSRARSGVDAPLITIETHLSNGLPCLSMVGLPETTVKESRERVRSALLTSRFDFPSRRTTINMAPADLPKEGGRFDLAIAVGILAASDQLPREGLQNFEFVGELALTGSLRVVDGVLPAAMRAASAGRTLVVPRDNAAEASMVGHCKVLACDNLVQLCAHLRGEDELPLFSGKIACTHSSYPDLADVVGQEEARRALEIAAAGAHNLLLFGPPGTGKTLLANRIPGILPPLSDREALDVAAVYSVARGHAAPAWQQRPFHNPHHTASAVALVGGGGNPQPGAISLAHNGVLFLDELPEFPRSVLEVLREPLESGEIVIARATRQVRYPSRFQLIAAMNPCPCGYYGDQSEANRDRCRCNPEQVRRYRAKISGPMLDRIDLHVAVQALSPAQLHSADAGGEASSSVRARVCAARQRQLARANKTNSCLDKRELKRDCALNSDTVQLLDTAMRRLGLSARAYHRILRVARTIADLAQCDTITSAHVAEAIGLRQLDRAP